MKIVKIDHVVQKSSGSTKENLHMVFKRKRDDNRGRNPLIPHGKTSEGIG